MDVKVFCREENPFVPDYSIRETNDLGEARISIHLINMARDRDRFAHPEVDKQVRIVIKDFKPDVVHLQHLNHLSLAIPEVVKEVDLPLLYTLHDFWLMCPRGQFLQQGLGQEETWSLCSGQDDQKCAEICYARYHRGLSSAQKMDIEYWTEWIRDRMRVARQMVELIDVFIAPSPTLYTHSREKFSIPKEKIVLLDYGFDTHRLKGRQRASNTPAFTFGYIGTHIPAKGIQFLIEAFKFLEGDVQLIIWGRKRPQNTAALKSKILSLPEDKQKSIEWREEYLNEEIVNQVFNYVDAIITPSIWLENSPLVIHEAQQTRVPVITADVGGMADYVHHEVNGLLFKHRNANDLAKQMQRFIDDPKLAKKLGKRGYLYSEDRNIVNIEQHTHSTIKIYQSLINRNFNYEKSDTSAVYYSLEG